MNESPRMPSLDELRAAITALSVDSCYSPSIAIFKAAHCNSDSPDRWALPGNILKHYGYNRNVEGWAQLCHQLTGLITADRGYYMEQAYDKGLSTQHRQPPAKRVWRVDTLGYSFRRRQYYRETILIS